MNTQRAVPRAALRAARAERGWSQTDAARELRVIAVARGGAEVSEVSLKTQLSRWENGHAVPEAPQRALLTELYGRTAQELDLLPAAERADATGAERVRGAVAAAGAVDVAALALWQRQLENARQLDDDLGDAGAGRLTRAQVEQLHVTLVHTASRPRRTAVARLLAAAAGLAGVQSLDRGEPESAWAHHELVHTAGLETGSPSALLVAAAGRAAVLREIGAPEQAVALLDGELAGDPTGDPSTGAPSPAQALSPAQAPSPARALSAAELGLAHAVLGAPEPALAAFEEARRALTGSTLAAPDVALPSGFVAELDADRFTHTGDSTPVEEAQQLEGPDELLAAHAESVWQRWPGFDLLDLMCRRGQALALLREPDAVTVLQAALASRPRQARVRAELHAELSIALHGTGRSSEAAQHGREAREIAERIGSRRVPARLAAERAP